MSLLAVTFLAPLVPLVDLAVTELFLLLHIIVKLIDLTDAVTLALFVLTLVPLVVVPPNVLALPLPMLPLSTCLFLHALLI